MSEEGVKAFLRTLAQDSAKRQQLDLTGKTESQQLEALVAAGVADGQEFTVDELKSVLGAGPPGEGGELNEEELGAVAGGIDGIVRVTTVPRLLTQWGVNLAWAECG